MRISACITTRNRPQQLQACLQALANTELKPDHVVVSDDSPDEQMQQQNQNIVTSFYPGAKYILGPRTGVCGNRNNAVNSIPASETDLVAFLDDDICVEADFFVKAIDRYQQMSPEQQNLTIISGVSRTPQGEEMVSGKLTFRGYFATTDTTPETVAIHATLFPRHFFDKEQWDENIFFGYEDAELCLRALRRGYKIIHCPELLVMHIAPGSQSSMRFADIGNLSNYEISIEAARLYVGIKRYKDLFPNPLKLVLFVALFFVHMTVYLFKRQALPAFPEILRRSKIQRLWETANI